MPPPGSVLGGGPTQEVQGIGQGSSVQLRQPEVAHDKGLAVSLSLLWCSEWSVFESTKALS